MACLVSFLAQDMATQFSNISAPILPPSGTKKTGLVSEIHLFHRLLCILVWPRHHQKANLKAVWDWHVLRNVQFMNDEVPFLLSFPWSISSVCTGPGPCRCRWLPPWWCIHCISHRNCMSFAHPLCCRTSSLALTDILLKPNPASLSKPASVAL